MPNDSPDLLTRYQQGDAAAADAIVARYTKRLLALARSRLSPKLARRIDADDVLQSTYRSFFVHAKEGEIVASADGDLWQLLASITLHKLGRQSQRHLAKKRSLRREADRQSDSGDSMANVADREPSPADVIATLEELHWLMTQFEPIQREALQLRLQEMTAVEIAATIGRSERTVRRWLVEARELLVNRWARQNLADGAQSNAEARAAYANCVGGDVQAPLRHSDYHLDALIGSGGMSKVYAATQKSTHRRVAIKVLRKRLRSRPHLVGRFVREAQIVVRLNHRNIVRVHGLGRLPDGNYFIAMDLVNGSDLERLLGSKPFTAQRAAEIVAAVADAIQHAHEHGVIHRDLKPGNVLLDRDGQVYVTDFGFAWFDDETDQTDRSIVGTAAFMAPEQIDPRLGPIGPHTDVYGLGALLFMLCCGRPPNVGNSVSEILEQVAKPDRETRHCEIDQFTPDALGRICERCLAQKWQERFSAATDVAVALRASATSI